MSTTSKCCPQCDGPIPAEAPQGLCPKCLLQQACVPTEAGGGASAKPAPPAIADLAAAFPQLEILELIGQGGMGCVFKARQPKLDRFVALKILPQSLASDPAFAERFTREGRVLARLNHPNIVTIHDFGQAGGFFFLLMEFVDGVNLRQAMRMGRFTPAQALSVVPKICEALQFAHNEGILHRDIKPENILLDAKGRVKIADFGIAKLTGETRLEAGLTACGAALGTPHYMAPEQIEHPQEVDQRADIYSLGVVFYEMLTGELPLGRFAPPSEKSEADPRLDQVVLQTLEKERERRTQSAAEVKTQVETLSRGGTVSPAGYHPAPMYAAQATAKPDRFWRWFAVALVGLITVPIMIGILGVLLAMALPALVKLRQRATTSQPQSPAVPGATNTLSASAETWDPTVESWATPDPAKILGDAKKFMLKGDYEEALKRHLWYHRHALELDRGQTGVRLSFALSDWMELGRRYPKARQAFIEIRDHQARALAEGRGHAEMFQEVQSLNRELQDEDATYALFKTVREKDPQLAGQCYFYLEDLLVSKGEYQWCFDHMGGPQHRFSLIRQGFDLQQGRLPSLRGTPVRSVRLPSGDDTASAPDAPPAPSPLLPPMTANVLGMMRKSAEDRFVGQTRQLIEILVATEHKTEAEEIRDQAITVLDSPRLKSAVEDAEIKLRH